MAEADNMANSWCEGQLEDRAVRRLRFPIVQASEPPFNVREAAIAWAREHGIIGEMTDAETNGKGPILISVGSLREMLNPVQIGKSSSLRAHFAAVSVLRFEGALHRVKLTLKRFADENAPTKAYAYHVTQIEVLAGTIGNDLSGTAPNANTPTTNQEEANPRLTGDILLQDVRNVNGVPLISNT